MSLDKRLSSGHVESRVVCCNYSNWIAQFYGELHVEP